MMFSSKENLRLFSPRRCKSRGCRSLDPAFGEILGVEGKVPLKAEYFTANLRECAGGTQAQVEDPELARRCGILGFPEMKK
jgi:hypothetical protein